MALTSILTGFFQNGAGFRFFAVFPMERRI